MVVIVTKSFLKDRKYVDLGLDLLAVGALAQMAGGQVGSPVAVTVGHLVGQVLALNLPNPDNVDYVIDLVATLIGSLAAQKAGNGGINWGWTLGFTAAHAVVHFVTMRIPNGAEME